MMSEFHYLWLQAFVLTQLIEIATGMMLPRQFSYWKTIIYIACASTITHPILWFIIYKWSVQQEWAHSTFLLVGEGYVWLVEGLFYRLCGFKRPFLLAFILNITSFLIGLLLQEYIW